jgi:hypothetical protein
MERFFGGSPAVVILKLLTASLIIGVVLSFFELNPDNLYHAVIRLGEWFSSLGLGFVKSAGSYVILGALIVIPVWLLVRFLAFLGSAGRSEPRPEPSSRRSKK